MWWGNNKEKKVRLDPQKMNGKAIALYDFLKSRMVGQDLAIERIVKSYNLSLTPLKEGGKPIFAGLFLGPSGSGKTYLAELLSEFLFDDRQGLVKIACAEYSQSHEVARLFGSPPGYVGYYDPHNGKGSPPILSQKNINRAAIKKFISDCERYDKGVRELTEEIEQIQRQIEEITDMESKAIKILMEQLENLNNQRAARIERIFEKQNIPLLSVILFDEIEKAHPAVWNTLLEITSKAIATMGNGDKTDFSNSFIIMTSNIGSREIHDVLSGKRQIGFNVSSDNPYELVYSSAMDQLKKTFPPELIGRIKENIVVFRPLTKEQLLSIIRLQVNSLITRVGRDLGMAIYVSEDAINFILERSCDHPEYGARLVEDKIRHYIVEPMAALIGSEQIKKGDCIYVEREGDKLSFFLGPSLLQI